MILLLSVTIGFSLTAAIAAVYGAVVSYKLSERVAKLERIGILMAPTEREVLKRNAALGQPGESVKIPIRMSRRDVRSWIERTALQNAEQKA